ncbi:putative zinc-binding peptidase [Hymenobacter sp. YC55]|uniref:zinc-binding metallopeptidase family protein n=1 Tax=Hymenobacter sp. YC55 TaxID=3034019 RepID=UPI0023F7CD3C|nr:putative zinc-binding peptidase [Hymenobacter sp. YC55]MDF7813149.1 putative zinc-binding peptidase [Hymenobacter sp. YC55]
MQLFKCTHCGQLLYFENDKCEKCQYPLGFESQQLRLLPLVPEPDGSTFRLYGATEPTAPTYTYCHNHTEQACNWLVPAGNATPFCTACALNHTIPNLEQPEHRARWQRLEVAKHRLVYSLLRMGLPVVSKAVDPERGLWFDFLADPNKEGGERVMTGHDEGLITINIAEADDIEREMARKAMAEMYRTLLGHFRHEVGHYYWDRLIDNTLHLTEFRALFGDEQEDYGEALKRHYAQGPPTDWAQHFISSYASSHPWEDWAETWAHYLHIVDTLQTAHAFGLSVNPVVAETHQHLQATIEEEPYEQDDFQRIMDQWLPLTFAMNSLNRSMGQPDSYPFIIRPAVVEKMSFIHRVCQEAGH